jgi:hypothetical protein
MAEGIPSAAKRVIIQKALPLSLVSFETERPLSLTSPEGENTVFSLSSPDGEEKVALCSSCSFIGIDKIALPLGEGLWKAP